MEVGTFSTSILLQIYMENGKDRNTVTIEG